MDQAGPKLAARRRSRALFWAPNAAFCADRSGLIPIQQSTVSIKDTQQHQRGLSPVAAW